MLKPQRDIVLVEVDKPQEKSASGIIIQENWKTLPPFATVKAIGPEVVSVEVGDRIIFDRYAAVILEGEDRLCKESHILARITDEPTAS